MIFPRTNTRSWLMKRVCTHERWVEITDDPATIETFDQGKRVEVVFPSVRYRCLCCDREVKQIPDGKKVDFSEPSV